MWQKLKHFFVPHHENDHKPHLLRDVAVEAMLCGVILLLVVSFVGRTVAPRIDFIAAIYPSLLIDMANESRQSYSLPPLKKSEVLTQAAQAKAEHMIENDYFDHISPDGVAPWHWFKNVGYNYTLAGENLAINFSDTAPVNKAWMDSPTHRDNILTLAFTEIGIVAVDGVIDGKKTTVVVQMFGAPIVADTRDTTESESIAVADSEPDPVALGTSDDGGSEASDQTAELDQGSDTFQSEQTTQTELDPGQLGESDTKDKEATSTDDEETLPSSSDPRVVYEDDSLMVITNPEFASTTLLSAQSTPEQQSARYTSAFERLVVDPSQLVTFLYMAVATVLAMVLLATVAIQIQKQHPVNVAYGCLLLIILGSAMYINETILSLSLF